MTCVVLATPFAFAAGQRIGSQGDRADGMYVIEHGRVRISARLLGEARVELSTAGRGDIIGELSLVDGGSRSASVDAIEPTRGYFISRQHFDLVCARLRPAAMKIMWRLSLDLCQRLRASYREIASLPPVPRAVDSYVGPRRWLPARLEAHRSSCATLDLAPLRSLPFFADLSPDELEALPRRSATARVRLV